MSHISASLGSVKTAFIIENSDANRLYVRLGGTAAADDYTFSLAQFENCKIEGYFGSLSGIWAADGAGHAMVTEVSDN
jgi:hypothetical protein